jgi:hypothetical protein
MFNIYKIFSDFYFTQYVRELKKNGASTLAIKLNDKREYWCSKMAKCQGRVFVGFGEPS